MRHNHLLDLYLIKENPFYIEILINYLSSGFIDLFSRLGWAPNTKGERNGGRREGRGGNRGEGREGGWGGGGWEGRREGGRHGAEYKEEWMEEEEGEVGEEERRRGWSGRKQGGGGLLTLYIHLFSFRTFLKLEITHVGGIHLLLLLILLKVMKYSY